MAALFWLLLLLTCGLGVVRMLDPAELSRRARLLLRVLLVALGAAVGLLGGLAWEMR